MNKIFKNLVVFMGTVFAIFMGFFGLSGVYTSLIGAHNYGDDPTYFFMFWTYLSNNRNNRSFPISEIILS